MFKDFSDNKLLKEINDTLSAILFHLKKVSESECKCCKDKKVKGE